MREAVRRQREEAAGLPALVQVHARGSVLEASAVTRKSVPLYGSPWPLSFEFHKTIVSLSSLP